MVNQSRKAGLGRTLQKAQRIANRRRNPRTKNPDQHTLDDNPSNQNARLDLKSVIAQTNLDEFLEEAELAGKQFITERRNIALINQEDKSKIDLYSKHERFEKIDNYETDDDLSLTVPRRPKWDSNTTPEQLDELERRSFLAWRRKLARLQEKENVTLTPFEKNLEIWRQLWRVIERSDIVVQILDARNPLLYFCDDLIKYLNEEFGGKKTSLILLNKADFLTLEQRRIWLKYFQERDIQVIFFSALLENENMKAYNRDERDATAENIESQSDESGSRIDCQKSNNVNEEDEVSRDLERHLKIPSSSVCDEKEEECRIYDKFELIDTWREILHKLYKSRGEPIFEDGVDMIIPRESKITSDQCRHTSEINSNHDNVPRRPLTVGLVGYPNVGKSSTINALLSAKRVAVSATPGKTKHFQTFLIDRDMMLCDCPGLVFPNFVSSKSEMVTNGILPIDQMKDCVSPVKLIVSKIPKGFFQDIYGLAFEQDSKQNLTADDLLNSFAFMRGYMTARGLPDISRASRKICKDFINGKILHCEPPPDADRREYHNCSKLAAAMRQIEEKMKDPKYALRITERQKRLMRQAKGTDITSGDFDAQYFREQTEGYHIKGLPSIGNLTQPIGKHTESKSGKHERKHKKKEKLRRVYRHLDE